MTSKKIVYVLDTTYHEEGGVRYHIRFDPPLKDIEDKEHEYAVSSTSKDYETLIFPADADGKVGKLFEIAGGRRTSFEEVISKLGYKKDLTY